MTNTKSVKPIESDQLVILKNAVAMAKYDLSRNQQKVFLEVAILAKNNPEEKFYKLYIREFLKNIGVTTNDTAELKREIEEMRNITIHIPLTKRGGELKANFFASVEIFENQNSRYIEIELSDKLKPYFIEIAEGDFFHYQIENTRVLKSNHSIRMYLYLKSWKWASKTTIKYSELRDILGVKLNDYKLFGDFKRRVLDKAQDELREKTDITFDYTLIRQRANNPNTPVYKIAFTIQENGKTPPITQELTSKQLPLLLTLEPDKELLKLATQIDPIGTPDIATMIGSYGRERVHDVLILANEEMQRGNKIRSLTAYLHNALKNNSANGKSTISKTQETGQTIYQIHKEIEKAIKNGISEFKASYYSQLGSNATQDIKDAYMQKVRDELAHNSALKSVFQIGDEWNPEALRQGLGLRLCKKSDDELSMMMLNIKKEKGFWKYELKS